MNKLFAVLIGIGVILLGLVALLRSALPARFDPVAYERQMIAIERARQLAPFETFAAVMWLILPIVATVIVLALAVIWGVAALIRFRFERNPDSRGLLPINAYQLADVAPHALGAYHGTQQIAAARQPVPHTITYSPAEHFAPRLDYRSERSGVSELSASEPAPTALPGITDLASLGFQPTREQILLGLGEGGERLTVPAAALCHVALVGATGGGKSNLLRLLLPQLQAIGARVCLADPHFAPVDPENGDDWRAIAARLHMPPAVTPAQIAELFGYLSEELERRLERRRNGQTGGAPLFLAIDELPIIADSVPSAVGQLGKLLREGRKVSMYSVGASQTMLVKVVGGDSSLREAYRTAFYVGGDLKSASVLLDLAQRNIDDGPLGAGVALLRSKVTSPARLVRIPYASNQAIAGLLTDTAPTMPRVHHEYTDSDPRTRHVPVMYPSPSDVYSASESAKASDPETARILARFAAGATLKDVIADVAGTSNTNSREYRATRERIESILREQIGGAQ